jgi:hypothetical protein
MEGEMPSSAMENYLLGRLSGSHTSASWLDGMPWYAAARLCEVLGAVMNHGAQVRPSSLTEREWHSAGAAGFSFASRGDQGILEALDALLASTSNARRNVGLRSTYGRFYAWLAHEDEDRAYDPVRNIVRKHVLRSVPLRPEDEIFGLPVGKRSVHSLKSASSEVGAHHKRLRKLLANRGTVGKKRRHGRTTFSAADAASLLDQLRGAMSLKQASAYLNLPRAQAKVLFDAGLLRPFIIAGSDGIGMHSFSKQGLDALLAILLDGAETVKKARDGQMSIPAAAKRACCSAAEIVRLIVDRRLVWKGRLPHVQGYLSVLIELAEVRKHVQGKALADYSLRRVEQFLGTSTAVVKALIEKGHLRSRIAVNPINRCPQRVVAKVELERFQGEFISLASLAKQRRVYTGELSKRLLVAGLRPAFDAKAVGASFFRVRDIKML